MIKIAIQTYKILRLILRNTKNISLKYKFILPQLNKSLNACHIEKSYKIIKQKKYQIQGSTNPN
jgi:hypothetical protein